MKETMAKSYDASLEYRIGMYDQLPYVRNVNLCGPEHIRQFSGNVVKYYTYSKLDNAKDIPNHDELMEQKIALLKEKVQHKKELEQLTKTPKIEE